MEKNRLLKLRGKSRKAKAGVLSASAAYSNVSSVDSDETLVAIKGNALRAGGQKDLGKASKQKESNLPDASINNYSLGKEVVHGPRIRDELKAHRLSSINLKIDSYGNTALHMAAARNDYYVVCGLLLQGANPNAKNNSGISAISIAIRLKFIKIVAVLLKHEAHIDERRDFVELQYLLSQGGKTALAHSAQESFSFVESKIRDLKLSSSADSPSSATSSHESLNIGPKDNDSGMVRIQSRGSASSVPETEIPESAYSADLAIETTIQIALLKALTFELRHTIVGPTLGTIVSLSHYIPVIGTELDGLWAQVFQTFIQLFIAANNKAKYHFIAICSNLIQTASELIKVIEIVESKLSGSSIDIQIYPLIKEYSMKISFLFPKQQMLSTMISVGPGEQREAVTMLLNDAFKLTKLVKDLVGLANLIGIFIVSDKPIEILFRRIDDPAVKSKIEYESCLTSEWSYEDNLRQNELVKEMSEIYVQTDSEEDGAEEQSMAAFEKRVAALMCQFVDAVSKLQLLTDASDTVYRIAAQSVREIVESVINTTEAFKQVKELITELNFGLDFKIKFSHMGFDLDDCVFPAPARFCMDQVIEATRNEVQKIVSSCQDYNRTKPDLHPILLSCVRAVKKFRLFTKELVSCHELKEIEAKEMRKKNVLSIESVGNLFKLWDTQVHERNTHPDTSSTILESAKLNKQISEKFLVIESSKVKGGKLEKLVDFLISHEPELDAEFIPAFIMTLHSFTTAPALLDMLIEQYEMLQMFQDQSLVQIKLKSIKLTRICSVLLYWINNHFVEDFKDFKFLIMRLQTFVITMIKPDFERIGTEILISLNQNLNYEGTTTGQQSTAKDSHALPSRRKSTRRPSLTMFFPRSDIYSNLSSDHQLIFELDPPEVCQQLALYEFDLFAKIPSYELLDQIWGVKHARELEGYDFLEVSTPRSPSTQITSPNITAQIQHTNDFTFWVASAVVDSKSLKRRVAVLKYLIHLAQASCDCGNLTGLTAIIAGLSMGPVARLEKSWLTLRVYLTDLTFLELGNPDLLPDSNFINFEKRRKVFRMIQEFKKYQKTPFTYHRNQEIQDFIHQVVKSKSSMGDWDKRFSAMKANLYDRSYYNEPQELNGEFSL